MALDVRIDSRSMFNRTPVLNADTIPEFALARNVVQPASTDRLYIVQQGAEDLMLIAHAFYEDRRYWWVIASVNNIVDPLSVRAGQSIRIPSLNRITT